MEKEKFERGKAIQQRLTELKSDLVKMDSILLKNDYSTKRYSPPEFTGVVRFDFKTPTNTTIIPKSTINLPGQIVVEALERYYNLILVTKDKLEKEFEEL